MGEPRHDDLLRWQSDRVVAWSRLLLVTIVLAMLVPLGRVVQLKVGPDPRLAAAAGTLMSSRPQLRRRGDLLDRHGRLIATSTMGYSLFIDPAIVVDLATVAVDIAELIGGDPVTIDRRINERMNERPDRRYIVIEPLLEDWQVATVRRADIRGVALEQTFVRHYPVRPIAERLIGTVGVDHIGLGGMEHRYDDRMTATAGRLTWLRDAASNQLWIEPGGYRPGQHGKDVRLSIDLVVQQAVEARLEQAVEGSNAGGGRGLVVDCRTGEILALCDILRSREGWDEWTTDPGREAHPALGRNRCATDPYEPGSTFKPFVWAIATELGLADVNEMLPTPDSVGWTTPYGRLIRDSHYYGRSSWRKVLVKSMNTGMAIVAERMSHRAMRDTVARFGFGARTGCGIPGESPGIVTPAKRWTKYSQTSVAFGHEISVTPLQMARAFCAFARDGTMPALRLTAVLPGDDAYRFERRVLSAETARTTREAMHDVMLEGTGRRARSEIYTMFGKSGTAQLPKAEGGGYHERRYVSSFVAGAPLDEPRIVVVCVIDDPDRAKGHWGGDIAGTAVRDIVDLTLAYLGVAGDVETDTLSLTDARR